MGPNRGCPTLHTRSSAPRLGYHVGRRALPPVPICPSSRSAPMSSQPTENTTPGRPLTETHAGLGTSRVSTAPHALPAGAPVLSGTPLPRSSQSPGFWSCLAPAPSARGGTFSFRGISTFPMAVSDSKFTSLSSFPGIIQHKLCKATDLVHRVERKRQLSSHPVAKPFFPGSRKPQGGQAPGGSP